MGKSKSWLVLDKTNSAKNYKYIATEIDTDEEVIGNVVVERPWYTSQDKWTYWMYTNAYGSGGFCGGATDLGLRRVAVYPETIRPYTQIETIKYHLSMDMTVVLAKTSADCVNGKPLCTISSEDEIPYELWK